MKIVAGRYGEEEKEIGFNRVRFVTPDGHGMFEVKIGDDGVSIEIRGIESSFVNGTVYTDALNIEPNCSNVVTIRTKKYEG